MFTFILLRLGFPKVLYYIVESTTKEENFITLISAILVHWLRFQKLHSNDLNLKLSTKGTKFFEKEEEETSISQIVSEHTGQI